MSRAARRRAEREAKKANGKFHGPQHITLKNPVTQHFEAFIVGNAQYCDAVVEPGSAEGQRLVLCGAGPSLADEADEYCPGADQIWGCNSALIWLHEHGHKPTHGFTVDQTPAMRNEWKTAPDVEYLVASTVHPYLTEHLLQRGRRLRWFHNYVGIAKPPVEFCECGHDKHEHDGSCAVEGCGCQAYTGKVCSYEDWLYMAIYPPTCRSGSGLNSVTRALDVAEIMGFAEIDVLGADCAMRLKRPMPDVPQGSPAHLAWLQNDVVMHADGGNALTSGASALTLGGVIGDRYWESKPDMLVSAVWLVRMEQKAEGRVRLRGDTLPNALKAARSFRTQDGKVVEVNALEEFIGRLPTMVDNNGNPLPIG